MMTVFQALAFVLVVLYSRLMVGHLLPGHPDSKKDTPITHRNDSLFLRAMMTNHSSNASGVSDKAYIYDSSIRFPISGMTLNHRFKKERQEAPQENVSTNSTRGLTISKAASKFENENSPDENDDDNNNNYISNNDNNDNNKNGNNKNDTTNRNEKRSYQDDDFPISKSTQNEFQISPLKQEPEVLGEDSSSDYVISPDGTATRQSSDNISSRPSAFSPPEDKDPSEWDEPSDQRDSFQCGECVCSHSKGDNVRANCTYLHLNNFPSQLPISTLQANASRNKIQTLNQSDIIQVKHLQTLILRHNLVDTIVVTTQDVSDIEILDLAFNSIVNLPGYSFSFLPKLRNLSLQGNELMYIANETFSYLAHLRNLDLSLNNIKHFDHGSFNSLVNLRGLYLYKNKRMGYSAKNFPPSLFDGITKLKFLCIQGSSSGEPAYPLQVLTKLKELQSLNIDVVSSAEFLGPGMLKLKSLTVLEFGPHAVCHHLHEISSEFFQYVPYIQVLSFQHCIFHKIDPGAFKKIPYLRRLSIISVHTYSIIQAFRDLEGLQNSSLKYLKLASLRDHGARQTCLSLKGEQVRYLRNIRLKELDLSQNGIALIQTDFLQALPDSLEILVLAGNLLTMKGNLWSRIYVLKNLVELEVSMQGMFEGRNGDFVKDTVGVLQEASSTDAVDLNESTTDLDVKGGDFAGWNEKSIVDGNDVHGYDDDTGDNNAGYDVIYRENRGDDKYYNQTNDHESSTFGGNEVSVSFSEQFTMIHSVNKVFHLPKTLRYVKASYYNFFGFFPFHHYIRVDNVQYLDVSASLLTNWGSGKIPLNMTHVNLNNNNCQHLYRQFFPPNNSLTHISMASNLLGFDFSTVRGGHYFVFLDKTVFLDISRNFIFKLPYTFLKGLTRLETLRMTDNRLQSLNLSFLETPALRMIDLRQNSIGWISKQSRDEMDQLALKHPVTLAIAHNAISCTCGGIGMIRWMAMTNVHLLDRTLLTCVDDSGNNRVMGDLVLLHQTLRRQCSVRTNLIVSCSVSISFFVIIVLCYYIAKRYRWWFYVKYKKNVLFAKFFGFKPKPTGPATKAYRYDAYLCYAQEDRKLAIDIADRLDTRNSLFIPDRDILYGTNEASGMTSGVTNSYKFLIVFTENFKQCLRTDFRHCGMLEYTINTALYVEASGRRKLLHVMQFAPMSTREGEMPVYLASVLQDNDRLTSFPFQDDDEHAHASPEAVSCVWDSLSDSIKQPER